jgi:hypothetical protein
MLASCTCQTSLQWTQQGRSALTVRLVHVPAMRHDGVISNLSTAMYNMLLPVCTNYAPRTATLTWPTAWGRELVSCGACRGAAGGPTSLSACNSEVATKFARSIAASGMSSTRKQRVPGVSITGHVVQSGCLQQSPATLRDSATQPRHSGAGRIALAVCRLEFQGPKCFPLAVLGGCHSVRGRYVQST